MPMNVVFKKFYNYNFAQQSQHFLATFNQYTIRKELWVKIFMLILKPTSFIPSLSPFPSHWVPSRPFPMMCEDKT